MFASAFDVFDAFHSPLHRGYHRPAKRHRRTHPYAAHLHPFYHIENLARISLDASDAREDSFDPEVVETDSGYLITALVPGVAAGDISVTAAPADDAGEADRLLVRSASRPHIRADLRLPSGGLVDADNITASCSDGVFRVVVPKTKTARAVVPVAGGDAPELAPPPGARVFRLDVPGFGARDLRVTVERPKRVVEIAFSKNVHEKRRFRCDLLEDENAVVSARCADGALTLVVAPPAPPAPVAVPVSAEAPALPAPGPDAAALGEDEITVLRRAVPGRKAAHFEVVATAGAAKDGATLRVSAGADAGGTRGRVAFATTLPRRLDLRSLKAFVVDGVLTVTAAAPPPAETRTVVVRADAPAALPESESPSPRAEAAAEAEKAEKANEPEPPATEEARAAEKDAVLTETP